MLTHKQLTKLLEIAEDNTLDCYVEAKNCYGSGDVTPRHLHLFDEYEEQLSFIADIKIQEGIEL